MTDLSRAVALAIEPEPPPVEECGDPSPREAWRPSYRTPMEWIPRPFSTDRNLLPLILAEVEWRGLKHQYHSAMHHVTGQLPETPMSIAWMFMTASPEQHCRAFLKAVDV